MIAFLASIIEGIYMSMFSIIQFPMSYYLKTSLFSVQLCSSLFYLGESIGALSVGFISLKIHRITILRVGYILIVFFNLILVFIANIVFYSIITLIIGFLVGIVTPVMINILCESLPHKHRITIIILLWLGTPTGQIFITISSLIILKNNNPSSVQCVVLSIFIIIFTLSLLIILFIRDSLRNMVISVDYNSKNLLSQYNLSEGYKESIIVYKSLLEDLNIEGVYRNYTKNLKNGYSSLITNDSLFDIKKELIPYTIKYFNSGANEVLKDFKSLFKSHYIYTTIIMSVIWIFSSFISSGQLIVIIPTLQRNSNLTNNGIYIFNLLTYLSCMVLLIIMAIMINITNLKMKHSSVLYYSLAAVLLLLCTIFTGGIEYFIIFFFGIVYSAGNTSNMISELVYPTKIRDLAIGYFFFCAKLFGFIAQMIYPILFNVYYLAPYYCSIGVCIILIIALLLIRKEPSDFNIDSEKLEDDYEE